MEFGFQGIVLPHACSAFIYLFIFFILFPLFLLSLSWGVEHLVWVWLSKLGIALRGLDIRNLQDTAMFLVEQAESLQA